MAASFSESMKIKRWAWVAVTVFAVTMLHGAYFTYMVLPKIYYGIVQIQMLPSTSDSSLRDDARFIRSASVLRQVILDLGLDKIWAKRIYKSGMDVLPPEDALLYMRKILRVDIIPGTNIIDIRVSSEVPKEAADVANAIADRYKVLCEIEADQRKMHGTPDVQEHPVRIVSQAETPVKPSLPNHVVDLVFSMLWGVHLGVGLASLLEFGIWYVPLTGATENRDPGPHNPSDEY